ncbi:type III polyketide synthase [Hyalangium gracile]|uniref:type III polyketide synthase n=1 Tax=Hyalangium gracile TaxID=394092 RepID=UPI001CC903D5|nr:type III polyketide synthase [Hyalangium gracile]
MPSQKLPTVLKIESAAPPQVYSQEELFNTFFKQLYESIPQAEELFRSTRVKQRHLCWGPQEAFANGSPPTSERMRRWERTVHELGLQSLPPLLQSVDRERVGSFVMASCTGYAGPTPEMMLARAMGLRKDLRRTMIGHMGCYAAFNTLKVAVDALAARPDELVLVNCTELCGLHVRPEVTKEQVVVHSLFGDASASLLLSNEEPGAGPQIIRTHTETHYETHEAMTWTVLDDGFRMTLSSYVPFILSEAVIPFLERLLGPSGLRVEDVKHWGIHPGGPKIVDFVARRLALSEQQQRASWEVLANYGNCSSSTILLILKNILEVDRPKPGEYGVFMAFGPGLTMESMLIRF